MADQSLWDEFLEVEILSVSEYIARHGVRKLMLAFLNWLVRHNLIFVDSQYWKTTKNRMNIIDDIISIFDLDDGLTEYITQNGTLALFSIMTSELSVRYKLILTDKISGFYANRPLRDAQRRGEFK